MHRVNKILAQVGDANVLEERTLSAFATNGEEEAEQDEGDAEVRWNGWGYDDTFFDVDEEGSIVLRGTRYGMSGQAMPGLRAFCENMGLDLEVRSPSQERPVCPPAVPNEAFFKAVEGLHMRLARDDKQRLFHSHGHTAQEIYALRYGSFARVVDAVLWPGSHQHVEALVAAANEHNVCLIPFGGGTSVSQALVCPDNEARCIVSVDMHAMSAIKWINRKNMLASIEAGAVGRDLEAKLKKFGLVLGHEPDSAEFSTIGGWVATRASGMRKNKYGNIEDIVVSIKMVTSVGTVQRSVLVPRMSAGPDIQEIILGSEGTLGIITEVVVKVAAPPEETRYGSIVFPDFESGVACMHEVALQKCAPVSIRLVDNKQFQFGQALKPAATAFKDKLAEQAKHWYVTKHKKLVPEEMVAATLLMEGTKTSIRAQEKRLYAIAAKFGGMKAGEANGIRGYFLTYMIAYLRDFGFGYKFMAESFETSVPWDCVLVLCQNVKNRIREDARDQGVVSEPFVSCRVTQTYDTGACVYFYFGFVWEGLADPVKVFSFIEHSAREEILKLGGSLSHHHGVGKLRKPWLPDTISPTGIRMLQGLKTAVDPKNVFASGNLFDVA